MEEQRLNFFNNMPTEIEEEITNYMNNKTLNFFATTSKQRLYNALPHYLKLQKNLPVYPNLSILTGFMSTFCYYSNKLFACGSNDKGDLGLPTTHNFTRFSLVKEFPSNIQQVIAGNEYTLVITEMGLYACGRNWYNLSHSDHHEYFTLTLVEDLPGKVQQIIELTNHIVVLTEQGLFHVNIHMNKCHFKPIEGISGKVQQLFGKSNHVFALTEQGLFAYGDNSSGQLGLDHKNNYNKFMQIKGLSGQILQVAAESRYTLVLTDQGLYSCGNNKDGQLGLGHNNDCYTFTQVKNLPQHVMQVVTKYACTFAVTEQGLFACGSNHNRQLGLGYHIKEQCSFTLVKNLIGQVQQVIMGSAHALVVTKEGLFACGLNLYDGELGIGNFQPCENFTLIRDLPGQILQITAGCVHTLVLTDQGLYACGSNRFGQLGLGTTHFKYPNLMPINTLPFEGKKQLPLYLHINKLKQLAESNVEVNNGNHFNPHPK